MITFIIPTLGRSVLQRALDSLYAQTDPDWQAIVAYDNVVPTILPNERISVVVAKPRGEWRAGPVRNRAIEEVHTQWVGLLDDDDVLTPDYVVEHKREVAADSSVDVFSYKMINQDGRILPDLPNTQAVKCNHIGISFAFHKRVFLKVRFRQIKCEDLYFLLDARKAGFKIKFIDKILYKVKGVG